MIQTFLLGVLLGSVPVAWILVRLRTQRDVSAAGSGNVGALNALRVSRSPWVGIVVVLLDGIKGAAAIWLATRVGAAGDVSPLRCAALVGVVAGHNVNPWLSLARRQVTGGKGFAALAGGLLMFRPWLIPVWFAVGIVTWIVLRLRRGIRDEAPATAVATLSFVPAAFVFYDGPTVWAAVGLCLLILPKHVREVRTLLFAVPAEDSPSR